MKTMKWMSPKSEGETSRWFLTGDCDFHVVVCEAFRWGRFASVCKR